MLHLLSRHSWIKDKKRRLWRWNAAWWWNYSGKWIKWQKARTGFSLPTQFEGGQTPITMQMKKKRWFKRYYKFLSNKPFVLSLNTLQQSNAIYDGDIITLSMLHEKWIVDTCYTSVKIVWASYDITKKITFQGEWFLFTKWTQSLVVQ